MPSKYSQSVTSGKTRFSNAPQGELEHSTFLVPKTNTTTFNGGDIVPIYCGEVLPGDVWDMSLDFVIRQSTVLAPTMGQLLVDYYAFFVPNRVVNKSWVNVMGENSSGAWKQEDMVHLATLGPQNASNAMIQIPVHSVADYYGFPTQDRIPVELFRKMHDLKFRGYLEIYNTYFRDQNYQPPIPYSKLNVYNGFISELGTSLSLTGSGSYQFPSKVESTGQFGAGSVVKEVFGEGNEYVKLPSSGSVTGIYYRKSAWNIFQKPFKANKLHDYFTSVLPEPQKANAVVIPISGGITMNTSVSPTRYDYPLTVRTDTAINGVQYLATSLANGVGGLRVDGNATAAESGTAVMGLNLDPKLENVELPLEDIRIAAATQQYFEVLARGGSRYLEITKALFGIEADNPYMDIPTYLGHFRRDLDLYQTAQTSATPSGDSPANPQGTLAAFGYTNKSGHLFTKTFLEHGYVHVFAVVRHRNTYSTMLSQDNFRLTALDYYSYPFANISEQPVYGYEYNPFMVSPEMPIGYQEAWASYRYENDSVSGLCRPGLGENFSDIGSLAYWTYADPVEKNFEVINGKWLESNTEQVINRTTALQEREYPQFKGQFRFAIKKQRPMPTYSVPGLDIL